jgi:hypothetical protein
MLARLKESGFAFLIAFDVVACTVWLAPLYVFKLAERPTGRQLISGYVGRARANGHRWAIPAAAVIDTLLGDGHCHGVYTRDQATG